MKALLISFSLLLSASLSGCITAIPNIEFCRDKGKYGAKCAYWLNAKETLRTVPPSEWNPKRVGMVCTSEKGMGNVNAIIEKLCQNKQCEQKINELIKAIE
jgi:hypothetical protein